MAKTYAFQIDAYSPRTIPMARLTKYMQSLAALLGHENAVHFDRLRDGSTEVLTIVDHEDVPKVRDRLIRVRRGDAEADAKAAQEELDRLLSDDNATGRLYENDDRNAVVLVFPGITRPRPVQYGPFYQEGSLDGILIYCGGADRTKHLQLQNGAIKYTNLETDEQTARRLGAELFNPIRVFGTGRWFREEDGSWTLRRFKVSNFKVLAEYDLASAVDQLREVRGSDWQQLDDPIAVLQELRAENDELH